MECERPHSDSLRQGDIFAAHPGTSNWQDPKLRFGLVLSADCDLSNQKNGPNLIYAPVLGLHNYAVGHWLPSQMAKLQQDSLARLAALLAGLPTSASVRELLDASEEGFDGLCAEMTGKIHQKKPEEKLATLRSLRTNLRRLESILSNRAPAAATVIEAQGEIAKFFELSEAFSNLKPDRPRRRSQLKNFFQSLADKDRLDAWPICDLIGLDGDMREEEPYGFVVSLRDFSAIPVNRICTKRSDWQHDPERFLRICRLRGAYKTDLLQRFSNLFVRVGLEDERLDFQRRMFERAATKLIPEA